MEKERREHEAKLAKQKEEQERLQKKKEKEERLKQAKRERKERKEKSKQVLAEKMITPPEESHSIPAPLMHSSENISPVFHISQQPPINHSIPSHPIHASHPNTLGSRISPPNTFNQAMFLGPSSHHSPVLHKNPPGLAPPAPLPVMNTMSHMTNSAFSPHNVPLEYSSASDSFNKNVGIIGEKLLQPPGESMDELESPIDELTLRLSGLYDDSDDVAMGSSSLGGEFFPGIQGKSNNSLWENNNNPSISGLSRNTTPNTMPSPSLNPAFDGSSLWGNPSNTISPIPVSQVLTHQQFVQMQKNKASSIPFVNPYPFHSHPSEHSVVDPLQPPISTSSSTTWTNTRYF